MKEMLQFAINDFVLDDYKQFPKLIRELDRRFESTSDVDIAIKSVKTAEREMEIEDVEPLLEELTEIRDDIEWAASKEGNFRLFVAENYEKWEEEIATKFQIQDLMVRAHSEKLAICLVGKVDQAVDCNAVISQVQLVTGQQVLDLLQLIE